jgi:hypothetical protein
LLRQHGLVTARLDFNPAYSSMTTVASSWAKLGAAVDPAKTSSSSWLMCVSRA